MPNEITITLDATKIPPELIVLIDNAYQEKPARKDLLDLRTKLEELPTLWRAVFDMTAVIKSNLVNKTISLPAAQMAVEKNITVLMQGMNYEDSSVLEKMLIDNVIITWLRLQWMEYQLLGFMEQQEVRMSVIEYWEKRLSVAQSRHLRACETLARVRKLLSARPALQVNIAAEGGQQVNVAGDVVKNNKTI